MKLKQDIVKQYYYYADDPKAEFTVIRYEVPVDTCEDHALIEFADGTRIWIWAEDIESTEPQVPPTVNVEALPESLRHLVPHQD